jgi:dynactin complex subunit
MSSAAVKVGARVSIAGKPQLGPGTVRFVGNTEFQSGTWIGVELDQPGLHSALDLHVRRFGYFSCSCCFLVGKNDGSVQGVRYFTCAPAHGLFIREKDAVPQAKVCVHSQ